MWQEFETHACVTCKYITYKHTKINHTPVGWEWEEQCVNAMIGKTKIVVNYVIEFGTDSSQVVTDSHEVRVAFEFLTLVQKTNNCMVMSAAPSKETDIWVQSERFKTGHNPSLPRYSKFTTPCYVDKTEFSNIKASDLYCNHCPLNG